MTLVKLVLPTLAATFRKRYPKKISGIAAEHVEMSSEEIGECLGGVGLTLVKLVLPTLAATFRKRYPKKISRIAPEHVQ